MADWDNVGIYVLDFETTGLVEPIDIIEVAWAKIGLDLNVIEEYQSLVNPRRDIPCDSSALSGIRTAMVQDSPFVEDIPFPKEESIIICHNAAYDEPLARPHMNIVGTICTLILARRVLPDAPSHSLATLSCYCDLSPQLSHRAYGDVRDTLGLLDYMLEGLGWDLPKVFDYVNTPVRLERFPWGKHKGVEMEKVPYSYITWVINNATNIDRDLAYTIKLIWGLEKE